MSVQAGSARSTVPRMRGMLAVAALVLVAGCGGASSLPPAAAGTSGGGAQLAADCHKLMDRLLNAEEDVDARLDVGMLNADYTNAVGDVAVAYNRIDFDQVDGACLTQVAVPLEAAYNDYSHAGTRWNNCIVGDYCDVDRDALPLMRDYWSRASEKVKAAKSALDDMDSQ